MYFETSLFTLTQNNRKRAHVMNLYTCVRKRYAGVLKEEILLHVSVRKIGCNVLDGDYIRIS